VLLASSPRYFAHSMNNPKDLPFAAMSVVALYCMSRLSSRWPYVTVGAGAAVALALGLSLGTRPGALLYFGYLPVFVFGLVVINRISASDNSLVIDPRPDWRAAATLAMRIGAVFVVALLVGTIFWPWAQDAPLTRPFHALTRASDYGWDSNVLFDGRDVQSTELPWSYLPTWFFISVPPVVLVGMALSIGVPVREWTLRRLALWATGLAPIVLIVFRHSTLYDGMRHVLFTYPPLAIVAASGWTALVARRPRWLQVGGLVLLVAGLGNILAFNVRAYPNQAAYVNELAGGPKGAFGRYELDYWGNCMLQAVSWSAEVARQANMPVVIWGRPEHLLAADLARFPELQIAENATDPHHLQIHLVRGTLKHLREMATWTSIHRVTTPDGALLCGVYPGSGYDDLRRRLPQSGLPPS
jgi:hypothetical protein